jgi:hypothetical protein
MKELKRDVDRTQAEKEEQELAFQQQLAAAEAKQKEYGDYFQLAAEAQRLKDATIDSVLAEKGRLAAELEMERQARLQLEAAVL